MNAGYTAYLRRGRAPLALFDEPGVAALSDVQAPAMQRLAL
jgi:hypothetical protein